MKTTNKHELQKLHSVIHQTLNLQTLQIFTNNVWQNHIFLVIDPTLTSDNPSCFRKKSCRKKQKLIMTIDYKIRDEKLQYNISRVAAKK